MVHIQKTGVLAPLSWDSQLCGFLLRGITRGASRSSPHPARRCQKDLPDTCLFCHPTVQFSTFNHIWKVLDLQERFWREGWTPPTLTGRAARSTILAAPRRQVNLAHAVANATAASGSASKTAANATLNSTAMQQAIVLDVKQRSLSFWVGPGL